MMYNIYLSNAVTSVASQYEYVRCIRPSFKARDASAEAAVKRIDL